MTTSVPTKLNFRKIKDAMSLICDGTISYWWTRCPLLQYARSSSDQRIPLKPGAGSYVEDLPFQQWNLSHLGRILRKRPCPPSQHISHHRRHLVAGTCFVCCTKTKKDFNQLVIKYQQITQLPHLRQDHSEATSCLHSPFRWSQSHL